MSTQEFLKAAEAVVRMLERDFEGLPEHLNFSEADTLAELARSYDNPDLAQALMLDWAQHDYDAAEYTADLKGWGIQNTGTADDVDWKITGQVQR